jgi:hypothetical protein
MMAAQASYIGASLDAIEMSHGTMSAYLRCRLGLNEATLARLQALLLEPVSADCA